MKPLTEVPTFFNRNNFKNLIIVFGVVMSIFAIASFEGKSINNEISLVQDFSITTNQQTVQVAEVPSSSKGVKNHHNFISSYFLQESSIKRERKKSSDEPGAFRGLVQLQKLIHTSRFSFN